MKLNSHTAFNLLSIVCMIVFIGALMLAAWAGLSKAGIIITGVVAMMIGDFAAIMLLAKYRNERRKATNGFNIDEVRMPRTALSTSVEILVGVLVALSWAMTVKNGLFTSDDGSFSFKMLFSLFVFTCTIIFMLWDTYTPRDIEHVGKLTNLKQVSLAILMKRSIALLLAVFMLLSSFPALRPQNWIWIVLIVTVAVVFITFRILIRRARN